MERVRKAKLDSPQGCKLARLTPGIHFEMKEAERNGPVAECVTVFRGQKPSLAFQVLICFHAISNATHSLRQAEASD